MSLEGAIAAHRFGLGARPGEIDAASGSPKAWLLAQIDRPAEQPQSTDGQPLLNAGQLLKIEEQYKFNKFMAKGRATKDDPKAGKGQNTRREQYLRELSARSALGFTTERPFAERLVWFWSNHFTVSARGQTALYVGAFEREAIRPHINGTFQDMLFAVCMHPAMLIYLSNFHSIGPNSAAGDRSGKGLNENLGRELLELHTLGVDGGYTQADVTSFAKVLTGWTFGQNPDQEQRFGRFFFNGNAHEPGAQTVLGQVYDQKGVQQGDAVLDMLAAHHATATHIATQLVRAFVADTPPPDLVAAVAKTFTDTGGDLAAVAKTLVGADAAWTAPMQKLRLPQEYLLAASRALNVTLKPQQLVKALDTLGQPLFNPPSPEGFHDDAATWLAPDAMTNRLDIAQNFAQQADSSADARLVADAILGDAQSPATREAIARAEGPVQGLSILLMRPEFQRR